MKKKFIILVIVAITISLLGLVGIQLYWIRNAVAVKEVNFERGVSEAVTKAIQKFNKIELSRKLLVQQDRNQQIREFSHILDSLNREYYKEMVIGQSSPDNDTDDFFQQGFEFQYFRDEDGEITGYLDTSYFSGNYPGAQYGQSGYLPRQQQSMQDNALRMFFDRSRIINDLFEELFSNRYSLNLSGGQSIQTLDSLLANELQNHGIKTNYEFGIYNPVFNSLVSERTGTYTHELVRSPYAFSLFPNDIFLNPEYLLLYFPRQQQFILSQMNAMMLTSGVLILIIISSFTFTILTIIRQKKLSVMKNDFINNMTHELKTPISTISLACQALSDQDVQKSEDLYQSYINVINEENKRLSLMTEKVLQTAIIEKGRIRLNKTGLDVHELIDDAIRKIGLQVKAKHGHISTNLRAEYSFLEADKIHLTNVIFNLLDNANKYSPASPQIEVSTENNSHGVLIHVKDNGIGISRANQKKIFENLYRVSTGNIHDVKGFGLGLSYVKAIVEQHGGYVSLESELKKGSKFTIFVPFGFNNYRKES
jgi:two-component system, OmpR family, phosphate regulon sensor histidine kinase PhoR